MANDEIGKITGKPLKPEVIAAAWQNLTFTDDPIASSLMTSAKDAVDVGLLEAGRNLDGHLRPDPAQRGPQRGRPAGGVRSMSATTLEPRAFNAVDGATRGGPQLP